MNIEIRQKFKKYMDNEAPKQLERLFDDLDENDGIMLQSCFEEFAEIVLNQNNATSSTKKERWNKFRKTGLLLYINQILHVFGWTISFVLNEDETLKEVIPMRTKYRGFDGESVTKSYLNLNKYLSENANQLYEETKEKQI